MACPVQSQWFHIVVFILGALVVLSRYVRGAETARMALASSSAATAPMTWTSAIAATASGPVGSLAAGVGSSLVAMAVKRTGARRGGSAHTSMRTRPRRSVVAAHDASSL